MFLYSLPIAFALSFCYNKTIKSRKEAINLRIDRRKHYIMVLDTETANTIQTEKKLDMSNVLVYDVGWQVIDTHGNVYAKASYVNRDIFVYERDLMHSAYYAKKIPQYVNDIRAGARVLADTSDIRKAMIADLEKYNIKEVAAHNARFDITALNCTQRYVTKSQYRYWLPYGIQVWDTMRMAESVILKMPTYRKFCIKHGFITDNGRLRKTAETLWRFISKNPNFQESHTGLEDVEIESQILAYCYRQHKAMKKDAFKPQKEKDPPTIFQRSLSKNMKDFPMLRVPT